ncbi:MAG: hypothetical protein GY805_13105, partial [Chloroflexi bacterium]|nr:hypothetical protein [Chloroflexota bacterium]
MSDTVSTSSVPLVERQFPIATRWLTVTVLLVLMTVLQLGWLVIIWLSGATAATYKLLPLIILTIVLGTAVTLLPERFLAWLPLDEARLARSETRVLLLLGLLIGTALVIFASQQRVWTFDEEGNLAASVTVAKNGVSVFFENYDRIPWLGKQHPPLIPIIYGAAMRLLGTSQLAGRTVTAVFALGNG